MAGEERALAPLSSPLPAPIADAGRVGTQGQLVPPYELALADFARHLTVSARHRIAGAWEGPLSTSTQTAELAALRRFYRWARSEGLRADDPSVGIRPRGGSLMPEPGASAPRRWPGCWQ